MTTSRTIRTATVLAAIAGSAMLAGVAAGDEPPHASLSWSQDGSGGGARVARSATGPRTVERDSTVTTTTTKQLTLVSTRDGTRYEVRVNDDDVQASIDGQPVPADRIKRSDDLIVILGPDGKELQRFGIAETPVFNRSFGWVGDNAGVGAIGVGRGMNVQVGGDNHPPVMVGINQTSVPEEMRWHLGLDDKTNAIMIERVVEGLPADKAGLKKYDVVVSIDGSDGATGAALTETLKNKHPGDELRLDVISRGERKKLIIELAPYDAQKLMGESVFVTSSVEVPGAPGMPEVAIGPSAPGLHVYRFPDGAVGIGAIGRELCAETEAAIVDELRRSGVEDADTIRREIRPHLQQMEEELRERLGSGESGRQPAGEVGEVRAETEKAILRELRLKGIKENPKLGQGIDAHLREMEESMRARLSASQAQLNASQDQLREAGGALERARREVIELRNNQLVLPEGKAWLQDQQAPGEDRLRAIEDRLDGLEGRLNERMDRVLDRIERLLDEREED